MPPPTTDDAHANRWVAHAAEIMSRPFCAPWLPAAVLAWGPDSAGRMLAALVGADGDGHAYPAPPASFGEQVTARASAMRVSPASAGQSVAAWQRAATCCADWIADTLTNHPALDGWLACGLTSLPVQRRRATVASILPAFHVDQDLPILDLVVARFDPEMAPCAALPDLAGQALQMQAERMTAEQIRDALS